MCQEPPTAGAHVGSSSGPWRDTYRAMLLALDTAVGQIVQTLQARTAVKKIIKLGLGRSLSDQ